MNATRAKLGNALAFQAAWLFCVVGAARGLTWLGPCAAAFVGAMFILGTKPRGRAVLLLAVAACGGLLVDGALVSFGAVQFTKSAGGPALAAPWMVALWVAFATTLPWSLSFLRGRLPLAALLGAMAGPLSYFAGARLGAIVVPEPLWYHLGAIAGAWALSLPALVLLETRLLTSAQTDP